MSTAQSATEKPIKTSIPIRMHDMPWSRFHWMVIVGLGTAWILDGVEVQIVAAGGFESSLNMTTLQVTFAATIYLLGQVTGALLFGRSQTRWGARK